MELKRIEGVLPDGGGYTYESNCLVCHKEFTLWYNGGELDAHDCCGYTYKLESPRTDFVIIKNQAPTE